jgi:hypothetical protein
MSNPTQNIFTEAKRIRLVGLLNDLAERVPVLSVEDASKIVEVVGRFPRPTTEPDGKPIEDSFANGYAYAMEAIRVALSVAATGKIESHPTTPSN